MKDFDPNDIGMPNGNYFGLPYDLKDSEIVIVPVKWDATTSYADGTSKGPDAMLDASLQVDLFDLAYPEAWKIKIGTVKDDGGLYKANKKYRKIAKQAIAMLSEGASVNSPEVMEKCRKVNEASEMMNGYVYDTVKGFAEQGRFVIVLGGEHSAPFGAIRAMAEKYGSIGILHIDAHADLRKSYEGFEYSHASIMYNALEKIAGVSSITQVAIRDFCSEEYEIIRNNPKVKAFPNSDMCKSQFEGMTWASICDSIIETLPENVYVSFDIDGLSPEYCPATGTPVPGGISFDKADYLLRKLAHSGRRIVGADLCEVAPSCSDEWDANVGARMLFKLCIYAKLNMEK